MRGRPTSSPTSAARRLAVCALASGLAMRVAAGVWADDLNMRLSADFRSAYIASGGSVVETTPVSSQCLSGWYDLHDCGRVGGYLWIVSAMLGQKDDVRRRLFNEIETGVQYNYTYRFCKDCALDTEVINLWNPCFGYDSYDSSQIDTMLELVQSLENPYVTPYYELMYEYAPNSWLRCTTGIRHAFVFFDGRLTVTPFASVIWGDSNRYEMKFEQESKADLSFWGYTAMYSLVGVRSSFAVNDRLSVYLRLLQYDIIDPAGRKHEKERDVPWAVCDYPVAIIGVVFAF